MPPEGAGGEERGSHNLPKQITHSLSGPGSLPGWHLSTAIPPFLHPPSPSHSLKNLIGLAQGLPLESPAGSSWHQGQK